MPISITSLSNYSKLFSTSFNSKVNPTTNLIYGASVTSMYVKRLSDSMSSDLSSYLSSLNNNFHELKTSSQPLIESNKNSILHAKNVTSESSSISGIANSEAQNKTYTFSVTKLAQSQKNIGVALASDYKSYMNVGTNLIKVAKGGKETTISFDIEHTDTNKEALGKMASAINDANLGITAKVVSNDTKKTSYLEITSDDTGATQSFSLSDQSGNTVSRSGADQIISKAADAQYKLDGKDYTSSSNTIELDNENLEINLNSVTEKNTNVTVKEDKRSILDAIESFASKYNQAIGFVHNPNQYVVSKKLTEELTSISTSKKGSLASIGINTKSDGTIAIDEKKLSSALDEAPARVKKIIGGVDGIAYKAKKLTEKTLASTSNRDSFNKDYSSLDNYLRNAMQHNQSMGLFVDMLL